MTPPHNGLPTIHPGEFIREGLEQLGLSQATLAAALGYWLNHLQATYDLSIAQIEFKGSLHAVQPLTVT